MTDRKIRLYLIGDGGILVEVGEHESMHRFEAVTGYERFLSGSYKRVRAKLKAMKATYGSVWTKDVLIITRGADIYDVLKLEIEVGEEAEA